MFLRAGQESALLASARTVSRALPAEYQSELFGRERILQLRDLADQPYLDGYSDDWPEAGKTTVYTSADNALKLEVLAGRHANHLYLLCVVTDSSQ